MFLADIHKLLHWVLNNVPEWQSVLRGLASGDDPVANLHAILYYDEVVCGNILTVHKRKKILAIYLYLQGVIWLVLGQETAWLPVACLQREHVDTIPGGAGAIVARLVKNICQSREVQHVVTSHQSLQYKLSSKILFVGDQDAHRMLWANKGSAGLKPCMFCSNVLKKGEIVDGDAWHTIASAEWHKFHIVADEEWL